MAPFSRAASGVLAVALAVMIWGGFQGTANASFVNWGSKPAVASSLAQVELLNQINSYRAAYGLPALQLNQQLCNAAQSHSAFMAQTGQFDHAGPNGMSPLDEARLAGYASHALAVKENIAMGQQSAQEVAQQWMQSPHHRANMLAPNVTEAGIGRQGAYWTLMLIQR